MFDENIVLRANQSSDFGFNHRPASSIHQFALCRFGPKQSLCLVTISHIRDKLIVQDLSSIGELNLTLNNNNVAVQNSRDAPSTISGHSYELPSSYDQQTLYISTKDVINSLTVQRLKLKLNSKDVQASSAHKETLPSQVDLMRDLLFIGCTNSLVIYDTYERTNLFNINTSTNITALVSSNGTRIDFNTPKQQQQQQQINIDRDGLSSRPTIFGGGVQKLYSFQVEHRINSAFIPGLNLGFNAGLLSTTSLDKLVDVEISSERSISDTITCLCHGEIENFRLILTGSVERKIKLYVVDTFDNNIQACRLTLNESSKVNCLLAINTVHLEPNDERHSINRTAGVNHRELIEYEQAYDNSHASALLPSVNYSDASRQGEYMAKNRQPLTMREQMNYFAYGLEDGFIGVYRLVPSSSGNDAGSRTDSQIALYAERLWRHKSRQAPVSLVLYDINGDGLDELVIGYKNSRLEARSPFTGQLLAKTRCFKADQLVGLTLHVSVHDNIQASFQKNDQTRPTLMSETIEPAQSQAHPSNQDRDESDSKQSERIQLVTLIACSTSMALVAYRPERRQLHRPLIDYFATRTTRDIRNVDHALRTTDELDEDEDWTSSLVVVAPQSDYALNEHSINNSDGGGGQTTSGGIQYKPDWHLIETHGDNFTPIQCESRQNVEFIQRISTLQNEQLLLRQKINKIYSDKVQQISMLELDSLTTSINLTYRWDFNPTATKLQLIILVNNLIGYIELFELVDKSCKFIKNGHLVLKPNRQIGNSAGTGDDSMGNRESVLIIEDDSNLIVLQLDPADKSNFEVKLSLRIYCRQLTADNAQFNQLIGPLKHNHHLMLESNIHQTLVSRVYERTIIVPRFSNFVLDGSPSVAAKSDQVDYKGLMRMAFKMDEHTSYLQILDWMRDNFLCFQFGLLIKDSHESWWPTVTASGMDPNLTMPPNTDEQMDFAMSKLLLEMHREHGDKNLTLQRQMPFDNSKNWSNGRVGDYGEVELVLDLKDLKMLREPHGLRTKPHEEDLWPGQLGRLKISYTLEKILSIECEDQDLLVDIIQSLVVECLNLSVKEHSLVSKKDKCPKLDAIYNRLNLINDRTRQLEESERRIQTELYESADMTKNLMQQFTISNQLNEFSTSKELLNELSMMLNSAQNSAQAFLLNNRARLKLSKEANNLKEKVHYLLEC